MFEMPNTVPLTVSEQAFTSRLARHHRMHWRFRIFHRRHPRQCGICLELERAPGCAGVKVFVGSSTGALLVEDDESLRRIFNVIRRRAAFHAEDEYRLNDRKELRVEGDPRSHPVWRDETSGADSDPAHRLNSPPKLASAFTCYIPDQEEIEFLRDHKDPWPPVKRFRITERWSLRKCYERLGTRAQMNPPVRSADHRAGIWRGIEQGIVDVLGSDHAPHTLEEKAKTYPASPSGMTGVQTLVPLMLDHVNAGRLSLARLVDLTSTGPARLFNIACKGRIAAGYDADFTIVDLGAQRDHHRQMGGLPRRLDAPV